MNKTTPTQGPITGSGSRALPPVRFVTTEAPATALRRRSDRGSCAVLIVESDKAYQAVIGTCVQLAGCRAEPVPDVKAAFQKLESQSFDVLIWGVAPEENRRIDTLSRLRAATDAQVVLLAGPLEPAQPAYEAGADQVLPKPFIPGALVGAVKAALRRSPSLMLHLASRVEVKGMTFDAGERTLRFGAMEVLFTIQEWDLLAVFLSNPNRFLSAREIIRLGWRAGDHQVEQIRTYVRRLRHKLEPLGIPCRLVSQHSRGYCLIVE